MKYGNFRVLLYLAFLALFSFVYAAHEPVEPLNAYATLETNDWNNVIANTLAKAIGGQTSCIVSVAVIHKLCTEEELGNTLKLLENPLHWSVFVNGNNTFCVLIPKPYHDTMLSTMGFAQLNHVANDQIKNLFLDKSFDKKSIEVSDFKNIFSAQKNPKRFFLDGHGHTGSLIAGLPIKSFMELLHELFIINTEFVYINSCFTAGTNLVAMQQEQVKAVGRLFTLSDVQFPIVIEATTDEVTMGRGIDFKTFFSNLDLFLAAKKRNYYLGRAPTGLTISQVIKPIIGAHPEATNLPSVRFPGTNSFFRAIALDDVAIITNLMLKQLLTKPLFEQRFVPGSKPSAAPLIPIADQVKYLLLYPTDCSAITFAMPNLTQAPRFISKIPGTAQHYIGTIDPTGRDPSVMASNAFSAHLAGGFGKEGIVFHFGEQPKAWFIESVISSAPSMIGLIIYKPKTGAISVPFGKSTMDFFLLTLLFKDSGSNTYYIAREKLPLDPLAGISWKPTSATWYSLWARYIQENTRASAGALYEASGGLEDSSSEEKAFAHFKQSMGIPFEQLQYSDNDIDEAITYFLQQDSDLKGVAKLLFKDLIKSKRFDIINKIIEKDQPLELPGESYAQLTGVANLIQFLIDANAYDQVFDLVLYFLKTKTLSENMSRVLIEVLGESKKGIELIHRLIEENFKSVNALIQQNLLMMLSMLVKENKQEFFQQALMKAQEFATSDDREAKKRAFMIVESLAYKNEVAVVTLYSLGKAMVALISHKNITISEQEINKIVNALRIIFQRVSTADQTVWDESFPTQTKQQYIETTINQIRELRIPSLSDKLEQALKVEIGS